MHLSLKSKTVRGKKACIIYWVIQRRPWKINSREFRYPIRHWHNLMPKEYATFFARRDTIQAILSLRKMAPFTEQNLSTLSKESYKPHWQTLTQNQPTLSYDQGSLHISSCLSFSNSLPDSETQATPRKLLSISTSSSSSKSPLACAGKTLRPVSNLAVHRQNVLYEVLVKTRFTV